MIVRAASKTWFGMRSLSYVYAPEMEHMAEPRVSSRLQRTVFSETNKLSVSKRC